MESNSIEIKQVNSDSELKKFVKFPFSLYKNNPYWTPPIIQEEIDVLNTSKNPVFENAEADYYLAYKKGEIVGRIAVIINWTEVNQLERKKVRFGWFDVIDDINITRALLGKVKQKGLENGLNHIEGPVGFSNLDKAGMLVNGFDERNTMITLYNAPYYIEHFKQLGYQELAVWLEYEIKMYSFEDAPEKVKRFSKLMLERYQLRVLKFKSRNDIIPYVAQMFELLDETYGELKTFVPIQKKQVQQYKEKYFKYIHPDFIKCIVDEDNKLVAFTIAMPSFSKALKKANGKMFPFGFLHLLKAMYFNHKASFYLIGVHPRFQNKGVIAIIFNEMQKVFNKNKYNIIETNPELEDNLAIQNLWKNYEHRQHKKRVTVTIEI